MSQGREFKPGEDLSDFIAAFCHPVVLTGSLTVAFGNLPITWVPQLASISVIILVARLLKPCGQHQSQSVSPAGCQEQ